MLTALSAYRKRKADNKATKRGADLARPTATRSDNMIEHFPNAQPTSIGQRSNALGFALLKVSVDPKSPGGGRSLVSPLSVTLALGMLAGGGNEEVRRRFCNLLGVPDEKLLSQSMEPLVQVLEGVYPNILSGGNAIFADSSVRFKPAFSAHVAALGAEVNASFASLAHAQHTINEWVRSKTAEMIPKLVDRVDLQQSHLVLLNALAFRNQWMDQFDPNKTQEEYPFHGMQGPRSVDMMMRSSNQLLVSEQSEYIAVCLPYKDATSTSGLFLLAYLPNPDHTVADLLTTLEQSASSDKFRPRRVANLGLPKFTFESSLDLKEQLSHLGYPMRANFTEMAEGDNVVDKVLHKTKIEVDEEGTRAAAATAVVMTRGGAAPHGLSIVFDRPFVFSVVDASHTAVFSGIYA